METLRFAISIKAPAEKVHRLMLAEDTYRQWTSAFNPGSTYKGTWEKGSKILFVGTDKEGKEDGMVSRIKEHVPAAFVSIEHIGMLDGGQEITSGPSIEEWVGALENYRFEERENDTLLSIETDTTEQFKSYFETAWPKALQKLKEICEA
ncbi:MAG: SRPBCC domain-containing protein [Sphingobacteriales bacterium]|nr:MAG: SRPBCC domain-containing protein [Sphingobacteriales bacterium]